MEEGFALLEIVGSDDIVPSDFRFLFVNSTFKSLCLFTNHDLVGRYVRNMVADNEELWFKHLQKVAVSGEMATFEISQRRDERTVKTTVRRLSRNRLLVHCVDVSEKNRQADLLATLIQLSNVASELSIEELLHTFLNEAERLTASEVGFFHLLDNETMDTPTQMCHAGSPSRDSSYNGDVRPYPPEEVWLNCVRDKRLLVNNGFENPHIWEMPDDRQVAVVRELIVPVLRDNRAQAILGVANKRTTYGQMDTDTIQVLAGWAWNTFTGRSAEERLNFHRRHSLSTPSFSHASDISSEEDGMQSITDINSSSQLWDNAQIYLDAADIIFLVIKGNEEVEHINRKGCELLGYEMNEVIGKNWIEHFLPERIKAPIRSVMAELQDERMSQLEYFESPVLTRSGEERIIAWNNTAIKECSDNTAGILSSGVDITKRKEIEAELGRQKMHLEEIVEERTRDLLGRTSELERFNRTMIGREKRIINLKQQINKLSEELGRKAPYPRWKEEVVE